MDGIEATSKLKELMRDNKLPKIPIIGLSAHCL